jgi:15-cis-phytoene synthase
MTNAAGMSPVTLEQSRQWCHELMRSAARNFYFGMSLLPEEKRAAMFALYAFMRHIDDIADDAVDAGTDKAMAAFYLRQWRDMTHAALAGESQPHPMFPALVAAIRRFCIPVDLLDAAIDGQLQDLQQLRYETFDDLRHYCYRVASTVGIAAIYIWGFRDSGAIVLADDRGVAFQLTNILRDIREDYARQRIYLPQDELRQHGVDLGAAFRGAQDGAFLKLMQFQIARAQEYYASSAPLEHLVEADARPTLRIMTGIYHGILQRIAEDPLAVLKGKVSLSSMEKVSEVAKGIWANQMFRIEGSE